MNHCEGLGGVGVIELKRIRPAREVRVAAVGKDPFATLTLDPSVILRSVGKVLFRPLNEIVGMFFDPGMAEPYMIGHEVQHQLETTLAEPLAQSRQRCVTAEFLMDGVTRDGKAGARNVFLT